VTTVPGSGDGRILLAVNHDDGQSLLPCKFYQLAKGARFEFRGKQFEKVAMSMAVDVERCGNVFWGGTEITPIGEPLLLPPEDAEKWKPPTTHWTSIITPAPGQF
jgi:hypothetical protein